MNKILFIPLIGDNFVATGIHKKLSQKDADILTVTTAMDLA